ncbi:MAG: flavodoxin family protein [Eggerthella lenta]
MAIAATSWPRFWPRSRTRTCSCSGRPVRSRRDVLRGRHGARGGASARIGADRGHVHAPGRARQRSRRYAQTAEAKPEQAARMHQLIENFDEAASHPDDDDLARLREAVQAAS